MLKAYAPAHFIHVALGKTDAARVKQG